MQILASNSQLNFISIDYYRFLIVLFSLDWLLPMWTNWCDRFHSLPIIIFRLYWVWLKIFEIFSPITVFGVCEIIEHMENEISSLLYYLEDNENEQNEFLKTSWIRQIIISSVSSISKKHIFLFLNLKLKDWKKPQKFTST